MVRKLPSYRHSGWLFDLPVQTHAGSDRSQDQPVVSTSTTAGQRWQTCFIEVSAASFTLIPVARTFTPVIQHGGRGGSHRVVKRFSPSACQGRKREQGRESSALPLCRLNPTESHRGPTSQIESQPSVVGDELEAKARGGPWRRLVIRLRLASRRRL